jgi:protein-S-isoprenylcysteine O-methyltransferase Ste14
MSRPAKPDLVGASARSEVSFYCVFGKESLHEEGMLRFLGWFQIVGLAFFLLVFVGRTLYLRLRRQVNAITLGVGKKGYRQAVEILFFVGLGAWIVEVSLYALSARSRLFPGFLRIVLIDSVAAKGIGMSLILVSFALFVWALASFGSSWRVGIDTEKPGALVTSGAFAVSRNPIFAFLDLYFLGTFLVNGTVVFLLFTVLITVGLHYQVLQEEKHLQELYGTAYEAYCARTGRYLGWWGSRDGTH